jgi:hypothetical protein
MKGGPPSSALFSFQRVKKKTSFQERSTSGLMS